MLSWFYLSSSQVMTNCIIYVIQNFLLPAKNIWRKHELLSKTIGVFAEEQTSYDNMTTVFYVAVVLVPTLTVMEILLYCLYQCKVGTLILLLNPNIHRMYLSFTHGS